MQHNTLIISAIAVLLLAVVAFFYLQDGNLNLSLPSNLSIIQPTPTPNPSPLFAGVITSVVPDLNVIIVKSADNKDMTLAVTPQTKLFDETGQPTNLSYFQKGFEVSGQETLTSGGRYTPEEIHVTKAPNIILFIPLANSPVGREFEVSGAVRGKDNKPIVRVSNLRTGGVYIDSQSITSPASNEVYNEFYYTVNLNSISNVQTGDSLLIEAFDKSSLGAETDKVSVTVHFKDQ